MSIVFENVERRIDAAGLLIRLALARGTSTRNKSSYYRSALILNYSIVEGLVYELVKSLTHSTNHVIDRKTQYIERHTISAAVFGTPNDFAICEKVKEDVSIDDKDGNSKFAKLNLFLKNKHHVSEKEYKVLNWVRIERNKIHLQGLEGADIGHTKRKINKSAKAILFLIKKLRNVPSN